MYLYEFKCFKQIDWYIHSNTKKYIHSHNGNDMETPGNNFTPKTPCGRIYNSNSGNIKKYKVEKNEINIHIERIDNYIIYFMMDIIDF